MHYHGRPKDFPPPANIAAALEIVSRVDRVLAEPNGEQSLHDALCRNATPRPGSEWNGHQWRDYAYQLAAYVPETTCPAGFARRVALDYLHPEGRPPIFAALAEVEVELGIPGSNAVATRPANPNDTSDREPRDYDAVPPAIRRAHQRAQGRRRRA